MTQMVAGAKSIASEPQKKSHATKVLYRSERMFDPSTILLLPSLANSLQTPPRYLYRTI
jgi:hypothetical protein